MICSICIATHKRPLLLSKLLDSLYDQKLNESTELEIIVVDNDLNESARDTCNKYINTDKIKFHYLIQPVQNISITRNAAVKKATGDYLFFIDDDTYAIEDWVSNLLRSLVDYQADGVFGAVVPYYENGVDEWIKKGDYFSKPIQKTGEEAGSLYTTNCLIKSELIKTIKDPFDPRCGLTGGEDGLLFGKLQINGAKFVFCAEAVVYDFVPVNRANLKYLTQRAFRKGITYNWNGIVLSNHKAVTWILLLLKGLVFTPICFILCVFFSPVKKLRNYWWIKLMSYLGNLAWVFNIKYKMYKD